MKSPNTARGHLADLELRHRRRARAEDRIRIAKDTGLTNLPLQGFDQEQDLVRHRHARDRPTTGWTRLAVLAAPR